MQIYFITKVELLDRECALLHDQHWKLQVFISHLGCIHKHPTEGSLSRNHECLLSPTAFANITQLAGTFLLRWRFVKLHITVKTKMMSKNCDHMCKSATDIDFMWIYHYFHYMKQSFILF